MQHDGSCKKSVLHRALAAQLADQLPKNQPDARRVVKYLNDLVENFLFVEDQADSASSSGGKSRLAILSGKSSVSPK
jgi:hypothetical protein